MDPPPSLFAHPHSYNDDDRFLGDIEFFDDQIDIAFTAVGDGTASEYNLAAEYETLSSGMSSGFPSVPLDKPDKTALPAMSFATNPIVNAGILPACTVATKRSSSVLSNQSSVVLTPSRAVQRRNTARRRYTPEKWADMKSVIGELYIDQGHPLPKVMQILEQMHNFTASMRQLRNKIHEWEYIKNKKTRIGGSNQDSNVLMTVSDLDDGEALGSFSPFSSSYQTKANDDDGLK